MMKRLPKSKTAPIKIRAVEKECLAIEMRKRGYTYEKIRQELGVSIGGVSLLLKRALGRLEKQSIEGASEYRRLQLERLDEMLSGCFEKAQKGDLNAVCVVLKIEERRARLLGLDFPGQQVIGIDPQKVEVIISKLMGREYDVTQAALEISRLGASLPEALRIMLSKTPPVMITQSFEAPSMDELDQRALEVMQGIQWQYSNFLPERRQEVIEMKQELKGVDSFNKDE